MISCWRRLAALRAVLERIAPNVRIGPLGRLLAPSYGQCGRCRTPWAFVRPHHTHFTDHRGCFPLCEACWSELTPATRLPYYGELFDRWEGESPDTWVAIERAVMEGR